jgi:hypothetical protein
VHTLPRNVEINFDDRVDLANLNSYKKHIGKVGIGCVTLPDELEKTINKIISSEHNNLFKTKQYIRPPYLNK